MEDDYDNYYKETYIFTGGSERKYIFYLVICLFILCLCGFVKHFELLFFIFFIQYSSSLCPVYLWTFEDRKKKSYFIKQEVYKYKMGSNY